MTQILSKGWFSIPGVQDGDRSLDEQLLGVAPVLAEAVGARVLDLGCAEGLIAQAFADAGAADVLGLECNETTVRTAQALCRPPVRIQQENLNRVGAIAGRWDIVLALAILHKLERPARAVADISATGARLVVLRLPAGSTGKVVTKYYRTECDLEAAFNEAGFERAFQRPGARGEIVQHWRR